MVVYDIPPRSHTAVILPSYEQPDSRTELPASRIELFRDEQPRFGVSSE